MNKEELLLLLSKIKMNNLNIDISKLLKIDNKIVRVLNNINDDIIFCNAYYIANKDIKNKLFVIEIMSKVKQPLISDVICKQVEFNNSDNYVIEKISNCQSVELAKAYRLLFNNKDFIKMSNYKEIAKLLNDELIPGKIRFINSILSNAFMIDNQDKVEEIIKLVMKCKDENIAFNMYRIITNESLKDKTYYKELIEKMTLSKNKEMSALLYKVISDKNMQERNDYIDIVNELFDTLIKDEYYELINIEDLITRFMENKNILELKEKLRNIPINQEIEEKGLVLVLKQKC